MIEVVVTVTTPPTLLLAWAMPGLPGIMIDVRVAPVWEVAVEVEARMTGTDMDRWKTLEPEDWPELVTRIT